MARRSKKILLDNDFDLRPDAVLNAVADNSKILFICSPNNPTGNLLDNEKIDFLINNFPGIVVVDEAYIDYAQSESWSHRLFEFPNLVVLQTFSKAWAMAGARLGMAFASEDIIQYMDGVKFPYNISSPTQQAALRILEKGEPIKAISTQNISKKKRLVNELNKFVFIKKIYPSDANFLLVKMENSDVVFDYLKTKKIIVRDRSNEPLCDNCLRITIGTKKENDLLLKTIAEYIEILE